MLHDVDQAGLVDGKSEIRAVPCVNARLVEIDDGDGDVGAFERNDGASRTT